MIIPTESCFLAHPLEQHQHITTRVLQRYMCVCITAQVLFGKWSRRIAGSRSITRTSACWRKPTRISWVGSPPAAGSDWRTWRWEVNMHLKHAHLPKKYTRNLNFNCPLSWEGSCDVTGSQVNLSGATMMMRQPSSCQVRRNFLSGIQVEFKQSVHQRSLRAQLHWLQVNTHTPRWIHTWAEIHTLVWLASFCVQVDNQLPGAIFPIVFNPVLPPKSIALDTGGVFLLTSS